MTFQRICDSCGELAPVQNGAGGEGTCGHCGGKLVGPVPLPVPETTSDRCRALASPLYIAFVAGGRGPLRSPW
jgi:hypothetical protein